MARRLVEAFNSHDREALFALMSPGAVMRTDPDWPGGGEFRGRAEMETFLDQFEDSWGSITYETVGEPQEVAGALLWPSRWAAQGKSSGIETKMDFWGVFTFVDGVFAQMDFFFSRDDAVEHARSLASAAE